jgi:hypothetical protein
MWATPVFAVDATPSRIYLQAPVDIQFIKTGELGLEPSFLASVSHGNDTGPTLENLDLQAFAVRPALTHI